MEIQRHAYDLEHALLYQNTEGLWKTIHPRWDMELLSFFAQVKKNKKYTLKKNRISKERTRLYILCFQWTHHTSINRPCMILPLSRKFQ